jgi:hypothetical protein
MGETRNDGGPAFPYIVRGANGELLAPAEPGMTLRDWFAGKALAGMAAQKEWGGGIECHKWASGHAYAFADAMLAERAK